MLDYYHARYYDPAVGVFLPADAVQGNVAGMNPYAYVGGNPETMNDPTGQMYAPPGPGGGGGDPTPPCDPATQNCGQPHAPGHGPSCPDPSVCNGSGGSGHNPPQTKNKIVNLGGCNAQCENDKLLVQQYIQNQRAKEEALNSAVGDILSLVADIFAAAADFAADAYLAFIIDVITIAGHFVALLANLSTAGLINIPRWLVTLGDAFQNIVPILAFAKGFVQVFGLGGPLAEVAGKLVQSATQSARGGLMSLLSGAITPIFGLRNDYLDWTKYNGELDAVNGYNARTAYNVCLQDYSSDPERC